MKRQILASTLLFTGCAGPTQSDFPTQLAKEMCQQAEACEPDSWLLVDGMAECIDLQVENLNSGEDEPCLEYHADVAAECLGEYRKAQCDTEWWEISICQNVFTWSEEPDCNQAVPGFVGIAKARRRVVRRRLRRLG